MKKDYYFVFDRLVLIFVDQIVNQYMNFFGLYEKMFVSDLIFENFYITIVVIPD